MGGSGGGRGTPIGDVNKLRELADRELNRAAEERRNVFISFAQEDLNDVNLLRAQKANELSDINFNDWSVKTPYDSENASYIRQRIQDRIEHSSITVVYLSPNAVNSKWVEWEVEKSIELGKAVIATHKGDAPPRQLPDVVKINNVEIVPWSDLHNKLK